MRSVRFKRSTAAAHSVILALATVAVTGLAMGVAPQAASACSLNSHCYAEVVNNNTATNHGTKGTIYVSCQYMPNDGQDFVNGEIWDVSSDGSYWEEIGIKSGTGYNGTYYSHEWFWADSRPGGGYNEHVKTNIAQANIHVDYPMAIAYEGSNEWYLYGGNSDQHIGTSTSQSATLITGIGGTEYTAGQSVAMRNIGDIYALKRKSSSDIWYTWTNASGENLGSGNWVPSSWSSSSDYFEWSGPC